MYVLQRDNIPFFIKPCLVKVNTVARCRHLSYVCYEKLADFTLLCRRSYLSPPLKNCAGLFLRSFCRRPSLHTISPFTLILTLRHRSLLLLCHCPYHMMISLWHYLFRISLLRFHQQTFVRRVSYRPPCPECLSHGDVWSTVFVELLIFRRSFQDSEPFPQQRRSSAGMSASRRVWLDSFMWCLCYKDVSPSPVRRAAPRHLFLTPVFVCSESSFLSGVA